ncbi:unnamed protein product [Linum trigynum]|uniref:HMA domain-containing protein n=1 Tax=Linum trigynum TaxID=586398 RepID=A0AAV2C937_9ROSI
MNDRTTAISSSTIVSKKKKMTMKKANNKMMKGFMCQNTAPAKTIISPAALFVCGANDLPLTSAIVPAATRPRLLLKKYNIVNSSTAANIKYSRLQQQKQVEAGEPLKLLKKPNIVVDDDEDGSKIIRHSFQVVVMRVSLHCQGCAGQVKRHVSKMEGVTSFSIDLEEQKVTVMGHVSPLVVVQSISKVKRAELWPTSPSSSSDV